MKKLGPITSVLLEKCHHFLETILLNEVERVVPSDNSALIHLLKNLVQDKLEDQRCKAEATTKEFQENENGSYTLNQYYLNTLEKVKSHLSDLENQSEEESEASTEKNENFRSFEVNDLHNIELPMRKYEKLNQFVTNDRCLRFGECPESRRTNS